MNTWINLLVVGTFAISTGIALGQSPREPGGGSGPQHVPGQPSPQPPGERFGPPDMFGKDRDVMWMGMFRPELQRRFVGLRRSPAHYERVAASVRQRVEQVIRPMLDELEGELRAAEQEAGIHPDQLPPPEGNGRPGGPDRAVQGPRPPRAEGEPGPGGPGGPPAQRRGPRPEGQGPNGPRPDGPRPDGQGPGPHGQRPDGPGAGPREPGGNPPPDGPGDRARFGPPRSRPAIAPEEFERLRERNAELDRKVRELSQSGATPATNVEAIRGALNEQFEVRSQMRRMELERITARVADLQDLVQQLQRQQGELGQMREELSNREKNRDTIIDRRIRELTNPAPQSKEGRTGDR